MKPTEDGRVGTIASRRQGLQPRRDTKASNVPPLRQFADHKGQRTEWGWKLGPAAAENNMNEDQSSRALDWLVAEGGARGQLENLAMTQSVDRLIHAQFAGEVV